MALHPLHAAQWLQQPFSGFFDLLWQVCAIAPPWEKSYLKRYGLIGKVLLEEWLLLAFL